MAKKQDVCAKCPTNRNITVEPKRPIGPFNAYVPVACRDCARRAMARREKLERLLVAAVEEACIGCYLDTEGGCALNNYCKASNAKAAAVRIAARRKGKKS